MKRTQKSPHSWLLLAFLILALSIPTLASAAPPTQKTTLATTTAPASSEIAQESVAPSGVCGEDLVWILKDGVLTISGTGPMYDFMHVSSVPWYSYINEIVSVKIDHGVTRVGTLAFFGCSNLVDVILPDSIATIGNSVFHNCTSLTAITIPYGVTSIGNNAFGACTSLTSITIPDSVTHIDNAAFLDCAGLTCVTLSKSISSINERIFYGCTGLTSIVIPEGVTSIGDDAFYGCESLTTIAIPNSVTSIGLRAFERCFSLTAIALPDNVISLNCTFRSCRALESVKLPKELIEIGDSTFANCSHLSMLDIPDGVVRIGNSAFSGCTNLKTVSIPDSVQVIGTSAFVTCTELENIVIPYGVQSIWHNTFQDCTRMQSIYIPVTVERIETYAFLGCSSLKDVYYTGSEAQWNSILRYHEEKATGLDHATIHYLETEKQDDVVVENDIQLTEGGQPDLIDRFILPAYGQALYSWLDESTDGDGKDDVLMNDVSEGYGIYTYKKQISIIAENPQELAVKLAQEEHALIKTAQVVFFLFLQEHPEVNWIEPVSDVSYDKQILSDTSGRIEIGVSIYYNAIEIDEYYASVELRERVTADIISVIPDDASIIDKIRYFNAYLTRNNSYNSEYPNQSDSSHDAITALVGSVGAEGPVCEAYARAFKILCETQNIPCAYVTGTSNGESHGWNLVQLEDGNWYAVDVTWNDPLVSGVDTPISGYESENYLLVGKQTAIHGTRFGESHIEYMKKYVPNTSFPLPKGPTLSQTQYTSVETSGHIEVLDKAINPTCTEDGLTEGKHCYLCKEVLVKQQPASATGHTFHYEVTTPPCIDSAGTLTGVCVDCGLCDTVVLPQLNTEDYTHHRISDATCETDGIDRYDWNHADYGSYSFDVSVSATGHSYSSKITAPTCSEEGFTTYTCSVCGYSCIDDYTAATGHSYNYTVIKAPTLEETGELAGICINCSNQAPTVTLPEFNTKDYIYTVIKAPTCTIMGRGEYTFRKIIYGMISFPVSIAATGHSYSYTVTQAPTTEETGLLAGSCSVCSRKSRITLPKLNNSDYNYTVIKEPDHNEPGIGTYTWLNTTYGTFCFEVEIEPPHLRGDFDQDDSVTDADAMYLLRHTLFPERYPINQNGDFDQDTIVTDADAMYLLRHTLFPERYPLKP